MTGSTFRLLDERTGWDPRPNGGLRGVMVAPDGLRLAPLPGASDAAAALAARLLRAGGDGTWWLGTRTGIRRLGPCDTVFHLQRRTASVAGLAARGRLLAVLLETGTLLVLDVVSGLEIGRATVPGLPVRSPAGPPGGSPGPSVRFAPGGPIVVHPDGTQSRFDPSGLARRPDDLLPPPAELPLGVTLAGTGFRIAGRGRFSARGRPIDEDAPLVQPPPAFERRGQYLSLPLDSGVPGCRWHRIRLDVTVPAGTALEVACATTGGPVTGRPLAPAEPGPWSGFPGGDPDPRDWITLAPGVIDALITAPPGRHAYLRLRLTGDGTATPVVRQVRLDLPRRTSLDRMPAVYSEARDFTERFLSLFDAQLEDVDEVLDRRAALLDPGALPDDVLGWLGGIIGAGFEPSMPAERRRALLQAAPDLFRRRGTPGGIADTLRIALGIKASVEELGVQRPWGAAGSARVGEVRLFGRSRARVRLGASVLGRALMNGVGNPDDDAVLASAHRIRVHLANGGDGGLAGLAAAGAGTGGTATVDAVTAARVARAVAPAHLVVSVRVTEPGFVAGLMLAGLDTVLLPQRSAVAGQVVLGRCGVVARGRTPATVRVAGPPIVIGAGGGAHHGRD